MTMWWLWVGVAILGALVTFAVGFMQGVRWAGRNTARALANMTPQELKQLAKEADELRPTPQ